MVAKKAKERLQGQLGRFVQQYARKATKGWDPNDRNYDRKIEQRMKALPPDQLSHLLNGDLDDSEEPQTTKSEEAE